MPKKNVVSTNQASQTNLPNAKPNIFEWSKERINEDVSKLNKMVAKLQKSIDNHEVELADKKKSMEECKYELKKLADLLKQT
jgi:peptidoglycan hydrolase CwlO-like protein